MLSSTITVTAAMGIVAPLLTITRGAPQAFRVWRAHADGLSAGTWLLAIVVAELWLAWGFEFRVPAEIAANVPNLLAAAAIVCLAAHRRHALLPNLAWIAALSGGAAVVSTVSLVTGMEWMLSATAMTGSLCLFLPQLVKVFREYDLTGVSFLTWTIAFLSAASWTTYGFLIHQTPIWVPSIVMMPSSLVIAVRVSRLRAFAQRPILAWIVRYYDAPVRDAGRSPVRAETRCVEQPR